MILATFIQIIYKNANFEKVKSRRHHVVAGFILKSCFLNPRAKGFKIQHFRITSTTLPSSVSYLNHTACIKHDIYISTYPVPLLYSKKPCSNYFVTTTDRERDIFPLVCTTGYITKLKFARNPSSARVVLLV